MLDRDELRVALEECEEENEYLKTILEEHKIHYKGM